MVVEVGCRVGCRGAAILANTEGAASAIYIYRTCRLHPPRIHEKRVVAGRVFVHEVSAVLTLPLTRVYLHTLVLHHQLLVSTLVLM